MVAVCVKYADKPAVVWTPVTGAASVDTSTARCAQGQHLAGCSCSSDDGGCDNGAYATNERTCKARAHGGGSVSARAVCVQELPGWSLEIGPKSQTKSKAKCRGKLALVGCSCRSSMARAGSCESVGGSGSQCLAFAKSGGSRNVQAYAICALGA